MTRPNERDWRRDDDHSEERERAERRFRAGQEPSRFERYEASDWDRERYHEAPEYRREQSYGSSSGSDFGQRPVQARYGDYSHGRQGYDPRDLSRDGASANRGGFSGKGPRGYTRSDDRIREDVCDRLSFDDELDASDITVTVSQSEVTLEGTVPDRRSKRRAEDISDSVNSVQEVHNRLRANKGLVQEVGDKLMGRTPETGGHAGSGTRNAPAGAGSLGIQNNH